MKNKIAWIIILFASLFFSSCEKFVDVNQNPNNPTTVPPGTVLTTTQYGVAFANSNALGQITSLLIRELHYSDHTWPDTHKKTVPQMKTVLHKFLLLYKKYELISVF